MLSKELTVITNINSVLYVPAAKYADQKRTVFGKMLNHFELVYKISGENITYFNYEKLDITPGCIYLLPKGENSKYTVERIEPGDCIDIFFDTNSTMPNKAIILCTDKNRVILGLFKKMQSVWYAKKDGYFEKSMSLLYEILYEIKKYSENYLPNEKCRLIEPAVKHIENNFCDKNFNYSILHELCGISYTYFKSLFKEQFQLSPVKYVTKKRLQYACDLLKSKQYPVSEIAKITGFEDVYYFSKVFKNHFDVSPSKYY